jgi:hypothetical protein
MRTHCSAARLLAAALLVALSGSQAEAGAPQAGTTVSGVAKGIWQLPEPQYATGSAQGTLYTLGGASVFAFRAQLSEIVSPCLSCREGDLNGTLDDGEGPGPDFLVLGHWTAGQLSGQGTFDTWIWKVSAPLAAPVGRFEGDFNDSPIPPGLPGSFSGTWILRR